MIYKIEKVLHFSCRTFFIQ